MTAISAARRQLDLPVSPEEPGGVTIPGQEGSGVVSDAQLGLLRQKENGRRDAGNGCRSGGDERADSAPAGARGIATANEAAEDLAPTGALAEALSKALPILTPREGHAGSASMTTGEPQSGRSRSRTTASSCPLSPGST